MEDTGSLERNDKNINWKPHYLMLMYFSEKFFLIDLFVDFVCSFNFTAVKIGLIVPMNMNTLSKYIIYNFNQ